MHVWVEKDPMSPRTTADNTHGYYIIVYESQLRKIKNYTFKCVIKNKSIKIIVPVLMTVIYQYLVQNKVKDNAQKYPDEIVAGNIIYIIICIFLTVLKVGILL